MTTIYAGDVVQLVTGGAPLTVAEILHRDSRGASGDMLRLVTISAGGLLQETRAQAIAVRLFEEGRDLIPPSKDAPRRSAAGPRDQMRWSDIEARVNSQRAFHDTERYRK